MVDTDSPSLLPDIRFQRMPDARLTDNPCGGGVLFPWKERELSPPARAIRASACIYQINKSAKMHLRKTGRIHAIGGIKEVASKRDAFRIRFLQNIGRYDQ